MRRHYFKMMRIISLFSFLSISYALPELWPLPNIDFGAHIFKVNSENIANDVFDLVHAVLLKYKFIVIRDQKLLSIDGQRKLSQRLGALHDHLDGSSLYPGYSDVDIVQGDGSSLNRELEHNFLSDFSW